MSSHRDTSQRHCNTDFNNTVVMHKIFFIVCLFMYPMLTVENFFLSMLRSSHVDQLCNLSITGNRESGEKEKCPEVLIFSEL